MISVILKLLQAGAGLVGIRSPFIAGAMVAALASAGLAGAAGYLVHLGASHERQACEADALRVENAALNAELAEKRRAVAFINGMAERDAARAAEAEQKLRDFRENIDATPANSHPALDRDAARRVRNIR
jgi:hypothetical protein